MSNDKSPYSHSEQLQMFRQKAEMLISRSAKYAPHFGHMEMEELLHELQVFQIELEMQNDELRLSYSALEEERAKFAGLYDLAPVGYFILDKFGAIVEVNRTGLKMMDADRAELIGRRFLDYVAKNETDIFYNLIRKMRAYSTRHSCQLKIISAHGKVYYAQLEGTALPVKLSADLQFYIAVIDNTSRRRAEQRHLESAERLKMTLEASGTGTWEIDLKKQIIFLDDNSYVILGLEPWEFNGKYDSFFKLLHPEDRDTFKSKLSNAVKQEKELDTEFRMLTPLKGLRYIVVRGHVLHRDNEVQRFVGIIIDITDKKELEQEAEVLIAQHQKSIAAAGLQAQENERRRISEALHDSVAQLLYGIKLNLQNYQNTNTEDTQLNNTNLLLDQAITEVRNISFELAPSLLKDFGLADSVQEMAKRLRTDNFMVTVKAQGGRKRFKPELETSAYRIIQELVNNSMKHGHATETLIKIGLMDNLISLTVSDNGAGFNIKKSDYLIRGSGLLSIKNRVGLFNGNFEIKSAPGKGTAVSILLKSE